MDKYYKILRHAVVINSIFQITVLLLAVLCDHFTIDGPLANGLLYAFLLSIVLAWFGIVLLAGSYLFKSTAKRPAFYFLLLAISQILIPVAVLFMLKIQC